MPIIAVEANGTLLDKTESFCRRDVRRGPAAVRGWSSRHGWLRVVATFHASMAAGYFIVLAAFPLPVHLLAYRAAVPWCTEVSQPRDLAKSVNVE